MDNVTYANTVRTATTLKDTDILVIQQRNSTESLSTTDFTQMKKITVTNLLQTTQKLQVRAAENTLAKFDSTGQTVSTGKTIKTDSISVSEANGVTIPVTSVVKEYVDAESTRASTAEAVNANAIASEISRATNAEAVNANAIASEISRATNAEQVNSTNIANEITRATNAEQANANAIASEISRATNAEQVISTNIANEITRATNAEQVNSTNIANEITRASNAEQANANAISGHIEDTENPHGVTKTQVGLGNADNTSDANKPVSTAQQTALNLKEDKSNKVTAFQEESTDTAYPSEKLVDTRFKVLEGSLNTHEDRLDTLDDVKADKDTDAVVGNFASFDASGNPVDSGKKDSDYENADVTILKKAQVVDGLESELTDVPLSANQGKVLKDAQDVLNGDVATEGSVLKDIKDNAEDATFTDTSGLDSTTIANAINEIYAEKATVNGIATLDATGKIPATQLPTTAMEYKGSWDASSEVYPTTPDAGDFWVVSVAGTTEGEDYDVGDAIIYNGATWDKINKIEIAEEVSLTSDLYTATDVKSALEEIAGSGRTTETVKQNADNISTIKATTYTKTEVDVTIDALDTRLDTLDDVKADKATTYTKTEVDVTIDALDNRLGTLEGTGEGSVAKAIEDAVSPLEEDIANLAGSGRTTETVKKNSDDITKLNGGDTVEGSVANSIKTAINPVKGAGWTDENLVDHEDRITQNESDIGDLEGAGRTIETVKGNADAIGELDGRLDTLEGTGAGSVAKAIVDALEPIENDIIDLEGEGHTNETVKGNADAVALRELLSNKVTAFQEVPTDTAYPSEKLVDDSLKNLAGTGRTTETVKQNADNISTIKGSGYTEGSLKTHEDRLDTLDENKLNLTDYTSDTDSEIGKIQFYFRYSVPTGYLLCDGSYISQTDYPKLYAQLMLVYNNCVNHGNLILDGDLKITLPNLTETKTSLLSATTPTEVGSAVSSSVSNMGFSIMTSFIEPVMLLLPCIKCDN